MAAARELLRRTKQLGRFWIGFALLLAGAAIVLLAASLLEHVSAEQFFAASVIGTVAGLGGFAYLCISISCPGCQAKWVWLMASKRRGDPLHWSWHSDSCPVCDYSG